MNGVHLQHVEGLGYVGTQQEGDDFKVGIWKEGTLEFITFVLEYPGGRP